MKRFSVISISGIFLLTVVTTPLFAKTAAKQLVDNECSKCHGIKIVYNTNKNSAEWKKTLDVMIQKGANIKPEEKDDVIKYLKTLNK